MRKTTILFLTSLLLTLGCRTSKTFEEVANIQKNYIETLYGNDGLKKIMSEDSSVAAFNEVNQWYNKEQGSQFMTDKDAKKVMKEVNKIKAPTIYQDKQTYWVLGTILDKIKQTNKKINLYKRKVNPKYATLWTNEINAESRKVNGEDVLFLNKRLMDFCLTMSKIASQPVQLNQEKNNQLSLTTNIDTLISRVEKDTLLQERFMLTVLEFQYNIPPNRYLLDENHNSMVVSLINSMELFAMAHEYTHAAFNHDLKEKYKAIGETYSTKEDTLTLKKRLVESWKNEIVADVYGQEILNGYTNIENNFYLKDFQKVGGFFFLLCSDILDKSQYILQNKHEMPDPFVQDSITINEVLKTLMAENDSVKINYDNISSSWLNTLHPPYQIRETFVLTILASYISAELKKQSITQAQYDLYNLAINMTVVTQKLFELTKDRFLIIANNEQILKQIKDEK